MTEECYSADGEHFEDFEGACLNALEKCNSSETPQELTIFKGNAIHPKISSFLPSLDWILEKAGENALDIVEEDYVDGWPSYANKEFEELELAYKKLFDDWANKHNRQPTFFTVEDVEPIKVRVLNGGEDFEIIEIGPLT